MGQVKRHCVLTLRLSYSNFERLTKFDPAELHVYSQTNKQSVVIKKLSHSTVVYNAAWQDPEIQEMETLHDFMRNFFLEQFNVPFQKTEKKLFNLHFVVPAKKESVKRFLKWFVKFMYKKKIPLDKEDGFRARMYLDMFTEKELKKLKCLEISNGTFAILYSLEQHAKNVKKWEQSKKQKELEMKKQKELKAKAQKAEWNEESKELEKKEKREKMKEKLTRGRKKKDDGCVCDCDGAKKEKKCKVRKSKGEDVETKKPRKKEVKVKTANPDDMIKKVKAVVKKTEGNALVLSEKTLEKVFKTLPKGFVKACVKALEEKYDVHITKDEGTSLLIIKKPVKVLAKAFK